jgi:hypothetical protein
MADDPHSVSRLSIILGGIVLLALTVFLVTGGDLGGTKKVRSDADLPRVTSPAPPAGSENTGRR